MRQETLFTLLLYCTKQFLIFDRNQPLINIGELVLVFPSLQNFVIATASFNRFSCIRILKNLELSGLSSFCRRRRASLSWRFSVVLENRDEVAFRATMFLHQIVERPINSVFFSEGRAALDALEFFFNLRQLFL